MRLKHIPIKPLSMEMNIIMIEGYTNLSKDNLKMIQCFILTNIVLYEKIDKTKAAVLTIIATTDATA